MHECMHECMHAGSVTSHAPQVAAQNMSVSPIAGAGTVSQAATGSGGTAVPRVKWLSDLDKFVLVSNFERRGWSKGSSEGKAVLALQ